jgi:predicted RNA binding protein with dsRBD fold (UPF0201 family)
MDQEQAAVLIEALEEGELEVDVRPTEDALKVEAAVRKLFPDANLVVEAGRMTGTTGLAMFKKIITEERIRTTIATAFEQNASAGRSHIDLAKMAAVAGKVALDEDFPLGRIRLRVAWPSEESHK